MLRPILKYVNSHMYEIHALAAGTIAFLIMFWAKKPIKAELDDFSEKMALKNEKWKNNQVTYRRRMGLILIFLDMLLSGAIFGVLSAISPFIHFSYSTAWLSGILSLTVYAIFDQILGKRKREYHE